jgi:hypothetical protein
VKSSAEHHAERRLEETARIADRANALTTMADEPVALLNAMLGVGQGLLAVCEELRQYRQVGNFPTCPAVQQTPPIIVGCGCAAGQESDPARDTEVRAARGQLTFVLLVLVGVIVLLVVLCVVLALTEPRGASPTGSPHTSTTEVSGTSALTTRIARYPT